MRTYLQKADRCVSAFLFHVEGVRCVLDAKFRQLVEKKNWWQADEKILVAVSAGVDSVVLLHLLMDLPKEIKPKIMVAHVNHQLREISNEEELFVKKMCEDANISFFSIKWQEGKLIETGVEVKAREFRYTFFEKIMVQEKINVLLTAHHRDDQVETILMRLINGNRLETLTGIQEMRELAPGVLVRPLLEIEKSELYHYAKKKHITFFEDETNQENDYLRNRVRNEILPLLHKENPRFKEQLLYLKDELALNLAFIDEKIQPIYEKVIFYSTEFCQINRKEWQKCSNNEKHVILNKLSQDLSVKLGLIIGRKQQQAIKDMLNGNKPNQVILLKDEWQMIRNYDVILIKRKKKATVQEQCFSLSLNEGVFLSETEWLGYFESEVEETPKEVQKWLKKEMLLSETFSLPLTIRKRQAGDRLIMNQLGQSKKISRYFIDEKISVEKREKSWVVEDSQGSIKWLLPFRESYLSIRDETDKIHYKLVYYYLEDE